MKILTQMMVIATAFTFLAGCVPYTTGPNEVGVLTVKWSPFGKRGVQENVYPPGQTTFRAPFIYDWNTFNTRQQNVEMTGALDRGDRSGRDDLLFKTIDGNDISLDVIITYRVDPEKAPHILQRVASSDEELKETIVRTVARSLPRDIFGELNTEDFYNASERAAKADEVKTALNEALNGYGVIVERVGTRDYRFNPVYQQAIEDKKIADQQAEKLKAETRATQERFLTEVELAKATVEQIQAAADGQYEQAVIKADAYFEQQQRIAQAVIAEGRAEAEGILKMNQALAGAGGEALVKLKITEALKGKRIIMLPMGQGIDLRTTDVNDLLKLYGLESLSGKQATTN